MNTNQATETMATFTLCIADSLPYEPDPQFAFSAASEDEAMTFALAWADRNRIHRAVVSVRPSTDHEAAKWLRAEDAA